ncbi:MAG: hypothetical protein AMXMBFR13_23720 [Phycisphaerae bacterium]
MVLLALVVQRSLQAQWTAVGDGIEYREFTAAGPNNLFVARLDPSNPNCGMESTIAQGKLYSGREIVRSQASRYDDAINYWGGVWGRRNDVVVAINGDFFNVTTGEPTNGQMHSGWYCHRFTQWGGWSGMAWTVDNRLFMGACVNFPASLQFIEFVPDGFTIELDGINAPRQSGNLIIYTPQYDSNTHTDNSGVEVLVELPKPLLLGSGANRVTGTIRQIRQNAGSSLIPFDHIVISASGSKANTLLNRATVGGQVAVSQTLRDYLPGCSTLSGYDWTNTYACVGGNFIFLRDGVAQSTTNAGLINLAPRTAVAYNNTHIFFVVVDGRSAISAGMNMTQLANFCTSSLGATWGYNMDGGGSSTMVVNGVVKNDPSDGSERAVANGLMMINVAPRELSASFPPGSQIRTTGNANMRLGPGTNFEAFTTIANNTTGLLLPHSLSGVLAKGFNWWKCDLGGSTGWVAESLLSLATPVPPTINEHPTGSELRFNATTTLMIQAAGPGPLAYRWQKDEADLSDVGPYSGALTPELTVTGMRAGLAGSYRCRVSNAHGEATSNPAVLTIHLPDFDEDGDVDQSDFGHFQRCLTGTGVPPKDPDCQDARLDADSDIDQNDFSLFVGCMSGEGTPIGATCMQ